MSDDSEVLLGRLIGGDPSAASEICGRAVRSAASTPPRLLVAAALVGDGTGDVLARAMADATTSRDRQLVAIAAAHLDGSHQLVDALVRDHLVDHPDDVFVAWIASRHARNSEAPSTRSEPS
jgi:hypothetical protein